jgi:very-short-patch-repair endonuclease
VRADSDRLPSALAVPCHFPTTMNDYAPTGDADTPEDPLSVLYRAQFQESSPNSAEEGESEVCFTGSLDEGGEQFSRDVERLCLEVDVVPRVQLVMYANDVRVVRSIRIENSGDETIREIEIVVRAEPGFAGELTIRLDELRSGAARRYEPDWELNATFLDQLTERVEGRVEVEIRASGQPIASTTKATTVLTRSEWPGDQVYPELTAAFVLPNESAVADLLREAGGILEGWCGSPTIDGYQRDNPEAVIQQIAAIHGALLKRQIQYVSPPASFESEGQRVRLPGQIASTNQAACFDLSLFAAAAMEAAGLHPVVILVEGHAFCGAFLEARSWPDATTDDVARLRNELKVSDLIVFDPTAAVAGNNADFADARSVAERHLQDGERFRVAVDVYRARKGCVRPMASLEDSRIARAELKALTVPVDLGRAPDASSALAARARRAAVERVVEEGPARIEAWKRRLLDLTLRNRLLNLPKRGKIVRLMVPDVAVLEDKLAEGASFSIVPRPDEVASDEIVDSGAARRKLPEAELRELLEAGQSSGVLYADMDEVTLSKRLTELRRDSRTAEEEGGSSNLYLAIGILKFFESEKSEKARHAPVVLLPVQVVQRTAREGVHLSVRSEDARINVTLLRYLEDVHSIHVKDVDPPPDDGSGLDVPFVFQRFREQIAVKRGWELLEDTRLGMFSFSKILIWRDLDEYADRLLESKVVHHLVETPRESFSDGIEFHDPSDLDQVAKSTSTYVPLSADSSQLAAIIAAAEGKSFVLIGPPGTGKSQTITNLITHCLATGKSVLFVSEKMAALDVVYRRLGQVGLQEKCLELHSGKANKKEVLAQLEMSLRTVEAPAPVRRDELAQDLDEVRDRLNAYVEALHRERLSGESVFGVLSQLIGLGTGATVDLGWQRIAATSSAALETARRAAVEAQASASEAAVGPTNPLLGLGHTEYSPVWDEQAAGSLTEAVRLIEQYQRTGENIRASLIPEGRLPEMDDRTALERALSLLTCAPRIGREALVSAEWGRLAHDARQALLAVNQTRDERAYLGNRYDRRLEDLDPRALLTGLDDAQSKWFLPRFFAVRAWCKRYVASTDPKQPVDPISARADLARLDGFQARAAELESVSGELKSLLVDAWRGESTDVESVSDALSWVDQLREAAVHLSMATGVNTEGLLASWSRLLPNEAGISDELRGSMNAFSAHADSAKSAAAAASALVSPVDLEPWSRVDPAACLEQARRWSDAWERDRVRPWCRWQSVRKSAVGAGLGALVEAVEAGSVSFGSIREVFERSYGNAWYKHTISDDPVLRDFQSESHERAIQRFRELDDQLLDATHEAVRSRIAEQRRSSARMATGHQGGFLRREIQKKRRHRPIRTLFKEAGDLIRELRPCVLMSPLSVAQYLDPSLPRFDVVVFDEASQMPVWDAIGAIARGDQLIVVGDPKQLPPTNFFGKSIDVEADEGEVEDLESVLDECIASNLPAHTLSWHYRSRHESLIAFSNRHYYDGRLITFPAAVNDGVGVTWCPVDDGEYDFGKSRTNRREAEAVVSEIVRRLTDPVLSKATIGVVTLSQAQQAMVEDLLDLARRERPEIERFFDSESREPVFVKNLENVQGDERDVILFTVCYGPDKTGKVRMQFGPLNKDGGWRRLNVAITRARREILVFSTLRADQIDLNRTRSAGVRDLKRFLEFAEHGESAFAAELETDLTAEHDSPFEAEVCSELEGRGWTVHRQVGCSGYRIDLAVIDPQRPGRYLLGVECDGASYHSAPSARDRDKLRQSLLEGLGWALHRVWSTDWWENRDREVEDLLAALEMAESRREAQDSLAAVAEEPARVRADAEGTADVDTFASAVAEGAGTCPEDLGAGLPLNTLPNDPAERVEMVLHSLAEEPAALKGRLECYRLASSATGGHRDAFYDVHRDRDVARTLKAVVDSEAPIVAELAAKRVGEIWGYSHLKGKGIDRVLDLARAAQVHVAETDGERVLWRSQGEASGCPVPRVGLDDESRRTVEQIPLIELASLLRFWVDEAGPMPERDLFEHALRSLGLKKLGKLIRQRVEAALGRGVSAGWISETDGVVRLQV